MQAWKRNQEAARWEQTTISLRASNADWGQAFWKANHHAFAQNWHPIRPLTILLK